MSIHPQHTLEQAAHLLAQAVPPAARQERVPLLEASGRVLAADLTAAIDVPPFDRSPLDGYAVRSADLAGASAQSPVRLSVVERIYAGDWPDRPIEAMQAARIMTGAPIPPGADCVIRQEDTDCGEQTVQIFVSAAGGQNISRRGEDTRQGTTLFRRGQRLDWTYLAALASEGWDEVPVFSRPRAAVLATGSELTAPGQALRPGKIYDSNTAMLVGRLRALGVETADGGCCADDPAALASRIGLLAQDCDMVITSGGVSVGQRDCMPEVAERMGATVLFHGVAAKPGTPTMAMLAAGKPVLCLSGNPFAAGVMLEVLGRPALERLSGSLWKPRIVSAYLQGAFPKQAPVRRLIRARLRGTEVSVMPDGHGSGMIAALAGCNCLIDIPANSPPLRSGDLVQVICMI